MVKGASEQAIMTRWAPEDSDPFPSDLRNKTTNDEWNNLAIEI